MACAAMKALHGITKAASAFQAAARPLLCEAVVLQENVGELTTSSSAAATALQVQPSIGELAEGPYFVLSLMLDATSLCRADAACRLLFTLNRAHIGPWRALGASVFDGLELERDGLFEQPASMLNAAERGGRKHIRIDWKGRFRRFRADVPTFCAPFDGPEITSVAHPDEVAYFRCRLCTDVLEHPCAHGMYLEVDVQANPDNLSMAVVDCGCSSVTFSPDTGAVMRERKVREAPRKVEGAYTQPLTTMPPGQRFHGLMGLYLFGSSLAFFRRCGGGSGDGAMTELGAWETTGFVSDLSWAEGRRLTPSLAFRGEGAYSVRIVRVGTQPPLPVGHPSGDPQSAVGWSGFDWEVSGDNDEA